MVGGDFNVVKMYLKKGRVYLERIRMWINFVIL